MVGKNTTFTRCFGGEYSGNNCIRFTDIAFRQDLLFSNMSVGNITGWHFEYLGTKKKEKEPFPVFSG
jgi:hypothetical protein